MLARPLLLIILPLAVRATITALDCLPKTQNSTAPFSLLAYSQPASTDELPSDLTAVGTGISLVDWIAESAVEGGLSTSFSEFDVVLIGLGTDAGKAQSIVDGGVVGEQVCKETDGAVLFGFGGDGQEWDCISKFKCD